MVTERILKADLSKERDNLFISVNQYDNYSRKYRLVITDNGVPRPFTEQKTIRLVMQLQGDAAPYYDGLLSDAWEDGYPVVTFTASMLFKSGIIDFKFYIYEPGSSEIISTRMQHLKVQKGLINYDGIISSEEFETLSDLIAQATTIPTLINDIHTSIEEVNIKISEVNTKMSQYEQQLQTYETTFSDMQTEQQAVIDELHTYMLNVENAAALSAKNSESWAIGGTGTRTGENTNNSKYYSELAKSEADRAEQYAGTVDPKTLSQINAVDTSGIVGGAGNTVTAQALTDKLSERVLTIPSKTSDIANDSGFVTSVQLESVSDSIPTKTSDITNDSNYVTQSGLDTAVSNINTQIATKAAQTQVNTLQSQINSFQVAQTSGSNDSNILETQAIRTDYSGNPHITANDRISCIEQDLISGKHIINPKWMWGYISGTDGSVGGTGGTTTNISMSAILSLKIGATIKNNHTGWIRVYKYNASGAWISSLTSIAAGSTYTFTENLNIRMTLEGMSSTTPDVALGNSLVIITDISRYDKLNTFDTDISNLKTEVYNDNNVLSPIWELGYIDGSDGSLHSNTVSARTTGIIFMPKGSTIKITNSTVIVAIMKYVSGLWNSAIDAYWSTAKGTFTFLEDTYVRLNFNYNTGATISDLNAPNTYVIINKSTVISHINNVENGYKNGKKMVWFGTSIPAGTVSISGAVYSYPTLVGKKLGVTVYNESVGSSGVRAGHYGYVTGSDPMGYAGIYYEPLMRSLSLSSAEKQSIFDNWSTWQPIIPTAPSTIPDSAGQAFYKNCSWDVKLAKYLSGGSIGQCDLYVFDHGHNDTGVGYDYNALNTMPADPKDRKYFLGAMNFIIDKILSDNPYATICFIGHYENDRKTGISVAQTTLSEYWDFPLLKLWEKLGWTQKQVTSGGVTKTITQWWMPDDLHPHSNTTGKAIIKYADALIPFIRDVNC